MTFRYLRKATLLVANDAQQIDLSELHFKFSIKQYDLQTPNNVTVRIYNPSKATSDKIQKEFTRIIIQAGYQESGFGTVFEGNIFQARKGREDSVNHYLDLSAADGDLETIFAIASASIVAGSTFQQRADLLAKALGVETGYIADLPSEKLPRGKVYHGMAADGLRDLSMSSNTRWSIQNGKLQIVPIDGYLPDEAVVLTAETGLIGFPEQTIEGIKIKCLLDPRIKIAGRVKIDNKSILQVGLNASRSSIPGSGFLPTIADDGIYRVIVQEMEGDTRGQAWYSDLICIAGDLPVTPSLLNRGYS